MNFKLCLYAFNQFKRSWNLRVLPFHSSSLVNTFLVRFVKKENVFSDWVKKWASHFYSRGRYDGLDDGYSLNWPKAVSVVVVLHASLAVAGLKQWLLITCLARSSLSSILIVLGSSFQSSSLSASSLFPLNWSEVLTLVLTLLYQLIDVGFFYRILGLFLPLVR